MNSPVISSQAKAHMIERIWGSEYDDGSINNDY